MFKDDGFLIKYENAGFYLSAGESVVNGLYFSNGTDLLLTVPALPNTAWLDVWQERNMTGVLNRFNIVYNDGSDMPESIENGELHKYIKLAVVNSTVSIDDQRLNVTDSFSLYHKGNIPSASTSQSGIAQLSSLIDSESEETAPTSAALKAVNEKVNSQEIIQGSNSNGYYTKFPDGRLICGHWMSINPPSNLQGSVYYSSDTYWTFPHEFAQVDYVGGLASTLSRFEWIVGYGASGSAGILQRKSSTSHTYAQYRSVVAIGRWY
jgi:hypothetical protein